MVFNCKETYANEKRNITGINLGMYEKGPYLGIYSDIKNRNQVEIGINYLDVPIGSYDANFSENIKGRLSFAGLRFLYRRYYKPTSDNGIYAEAGLELNRISAYSEIKLSQLTYTTRGLRVRCPTCSSMNLSIQPNPIALIPSLAIGWQQIITPKIKIKSSIGIQYKKINNADWNYDSNEFMPPFVKSAVDEGIKKVNKDLENLPVIFPTIMFSISYQLN
tara:strand:- start:813 stop:1472 length:660 start_codon:yes stop_codon:yes gene_type:complete